MRAALERRDAWLLLAAVFALAIGSTLDWSALHPGYAAYDEQSFVEAVQGHADGEGIRLRLTGGSLHKLGSAWLSGALGPSWAALHLGTLLWVLLECALMVAWGVRLGSPAAGVWAVLLNLGSAHTWVRSRALLSFGALPAQLLLALWVLPRRGAGPWRAGITALGLSLLALDYELWIWGLPLLAAAWVAFWRPTRSEALAGLAAGVAGLLALAWLTGFDLGAYWMVRQDRSLALEREAGLWLQGLASLFVPASKSLNFLGAGGVAWAQPWVWAAAAFAAWTARRRALLPALFLALALAPVLSFHAEQEPQRLLLAWPLLCGAAAWGLLQLPWAARRPAWVGAALAALMVPAWSAFQRSQDSGSFLTYGSSLQQRAAVQALAKAFEGRPVHVLCGLDLNGAGTLRFALRAQGVRLDPSGPAVAPAAWDLFPQGWDPAWGRWMPVEGDPRLPGSAWLLPQPSRAPGLAAEAAELERFGHAVERAGSSRRALALAEAALAQAQGPWSRTLYAQAWVKAARELGILSAASLAPVLAGPLMGASVHEDAALALKDQDPPLALALADAACLRDPRRSAPWELRISLLRSLGRGAEAAKVEAAYRALRR